MEKKEVVRRVKDKRKGGIGWSVRSGKERICGKGEGKEELE